MQRKYLLIIIILAVLVRLGSFAWVATHGGEAVLTEGDATTYVEVARNVAEGRGFVVERDGVLVSEVFRAPGMSLLVAPFMLLSGGVFWWSAFLSILAGVLLPLWAYILGTRFFNERAGYISAVIVALEPHLVWFSWLLMSEMSATLLLLGIAVLVTGTWEVRWWPRAIAVGILSGALVLVRPPFFPIFLALLLMSGLWFLWKKELLTGMRIVVIAFVLILVTVPWSLRNHVVTGHYALSGMGWYNLYFDYFSSLDAVKNGTSFAEEKSARITRFHTGSTDAQELGIVAGSALRANALREFWERRGEVVRLEPAFLFSYFTHDGYFQYARMLGFLPAPAGHSPSITLLLLSKGVGAIPDVIAAMKDQYFVPLLGRAFTSAMVLLALASVWLYRRDPRMWLLALLITLSAGIATVIGLGVEARSRVPISPFLFVLAGGALSALCSLYREYLTPARHPGS
jgi:4-amino-4-deoxy-L-arabinose transferase-like glycosyltransferase